jgi:hypothetical protein
MKAARSHDYRIDGYGNVKFIKVDIGSGHSTFKVFWKREEVTLYPEKRGFKPRGTSSLNAKI